MLQGYFDDSGSDGIRPPFVLAGWIHTAERWGDFSDDWKAELDQRPKIRYFKMSEAAAGQGQFQGMPIEFRKYKVRNLLSVVQKHNPDGLYCFMRWDEWREFEKKLPASTRKPYVSLFFGVLDTVMAYEKNIGRFPEKVELDFDEQGEAGLLALEWYRLIAPHFPAEYKEIFGRSPTMLDDEDYMPLQAADMLAWSVRRDLDPDEYAADWSWLWSELYKITWAGHAFTSESWESVTKMLGI